VYFLFRNARRALKALVVVGSGGLHRGQILWLLTRGVYGYGVVVQTGSQGLGTSSL
jgi:hypothetical protein